MVCCVVHSNAVFVDFLVSSGLIHFLNISSTCSLLREADFEKGLDRSLNAFSFVSILNAST